MKSLEKDFKEVNNQEILELEKEMSVKLVKEMPRLLEKDTANTNVVISKDASDILEVKASSKTSFILSFTYVGKVLAKVTGFMMICDKAGLELIELGVLGLEGKGVMVNISFAMILIIVNVLVFLITKSIKAFYTSSVLSLLLVTLLINYYDVFNKEKAKRLGLFTLIKENLLGVIIFGLFAVFIFLK